MTGEVATAVIAAAGAVLAASIPAYIKVSRHQQKVLAEFQPNGGSSLRDAVDSLRHDLWGHAQSDLRAQESVERRLDDLETYTRNRWHGLDNQLASIDTLAHLLLRKLDSE